MCASVNHYTRVCTQGGTLPEYWIIVTVITSPLPLPTVSLQYDCDEMNVVSFLAPMYLHVCMAASYKCRKVYQAFRMLHPKDRLVTDVALGSRLHRLVGPRARCKYIDKGHLA